ncbi:hypothetical protein HDU76_013675 [Blyttiomyces sp. JEL0837]|nr:hypothetical protein HDU76_013675 [Blyttiomyces sp. JEL0837]
MGVDKKIAGFNRLSLQTPPTPKGGGTDSPLAEGPGTDGVSTPTKIASFPKMVTPAQLKIGLQQVLDGELKSPLSYEEFYDFLRQEHSEENIEFYKAVQEYRQLAASVDEKLLNKAERVSSSRGRRRSSSTTPSVNAAPTPSPTPAPTPAVEQPTLPESAATPASTTTTEQVEGATAPAPAATITTEQSAPVDTAPQTDTTNTTVQPSETNNTTTPSSEKPSILTTQSSLPELPTTPEFLTLKAAMDKILKIYFTEGTEKELNIPFQIRSRVVMEVKERRNYHPDVFDAAIENVTTMMRLSSFPNFYRTAVGKTGSAPGTPVM